MVSMSFAPFGIRCLAIGVFTLAAASGQSVLNDPKKIADAQKLFDTLGGDRMPCEVLPVKPHYIFSLRLQAGYVARLPLTQSQVQGEKWIVLTRITSTERNGNSVILSDVVQFPATVDTSSAKIEGSYWLGEGRYSVQLLMFDARGSTCRQQWRIDARLNSVVRGLSPILAPGTVAGNSANELPRPAAVKSNGRLTVLLHAASLLQRQSSLLDVDKAMLLDALVALMEELPVGSVRLVVFNLEQQKEILRRDEFTLGALAEVSQALDAVQPATVDYSVLRNPTSTADFIRNLANREIHASEPAGAVVFLGPRSIYKDKPSPDFGPTPGANPQFFYLLWEQPPLGSGFSYVRGSADIPRPMMGAPLPGSGGTNPSYWPAKINYGPNNGPDSIQYTVDKLRGKTMKVDSLESFAKAVSEIAHLSRMTKTRK